MKSTFLLASTFSLLAAALPHLAARDGVNDWANDMNDAAAGNGSCQSLGVIFARGTFDSGNLGVWAGPQFLSAVQANVDSVAIQGVDPDKYAADLAGYLNDNGGSEDGAQALADQVTAYNEACPDSKVVISGWSQGSVVAHKGLLKLQSPALDSVLGLVTFGDPNPIWENLPLPENVNEAHFDAECVTDGSQDPLCASTAPLITLPTAASIIDDMRHLPDIATGAQQVKAAGELVAAFPGQLLAAWSGFTKNLNPKNFRRLVLTPAHFKYGNDGYADNAGKIVGQWMSEL